MPSEPMLNTHSLQAVQNASFGQGLCRPLYENYCFANIPKTVKRLLTGKKGGLPDDVLLNPDQRYDRLVLLVLDGFGWRFLDKYLEELPFLKRFLTQGVISQITSQFPSTTVPHLTCLNTDLPVGQSGLYEWFYYEPLVDAIISPFRFALAGETNNTLTDQTHANAAKLFPFKTIYQELKETGISSTLLYHRNYATSPFSQVTGQGATIIPYASYAEAIFKLADLLQQQPTGYFYLYLGDIDSSSHEYGPESKEIDFSIRDTFHILEKRLGNHPIWQDPQTAFIVTADHGQISTYPEKTIYLNQLCPDVIDKMRKDFKGHPLAPAGSPRDYFLYIDEPYLEEVYQIIRQRLEGRAWVYKTATLVDQGLFGPQPLSSRFLERVGNLVILPYEKESVFWYEQDRFENRFYGNHGGLTRAEMETIFLFQAGNSS
jgi:predicted AlkP superfamily pyrophosphatase or phosphodiesterase